MENYRRSRVNEHAALSLHLIRQAQDELASGDRLQASEKAWGAAAHAVKAVAASRGWNHNTHRLLFDVVDQTASDAEAPELRELFLAANALHQNFYENVHPANFVRSGIRQVQRLVELLEEIRGQPAPSSVVIDPRQWERLTRARAE